MNSNKDNKFNNNYPQKVTGNIELQDVIDLKYIYKFLQRRKRIFTFSALLSLFFVLIYTGYQRTINPIYGGSFKMLISDPVTNKKTSATDLGSSPDAVFDYIARSLENLSNDIPTIIEYLKSEKILNQVVQKFPKLTYGEIISNLSVKVVEDSKKNFDTPPDVIDVFFSYKEPKKGLKILNYISTVYLESSYNLRQKRLSEGLKFLDLQEPLLKQNTQKLRNEISKFREKNNLLDPATEANTIKNKINKLQDKIQNLKSENERLKIIKQEVKKGNLISIGLETRENEGKTTGGTGLIVTGSDQDLAKELVELKKIYAEYLSKYNPSSDIVKGIEQRINKLEPRVLELQLATINSAIDLKTGLINTAEKQKQEINEIFLKQPKIISEFNFLKNKLELALEKEKALVKARENFQLETTQRSMPWLIIKDPDFSKNPIKPNITEYLLFGFLGSLTIGGLIAFSREIYENVFHDSEMVRKYFDSTYLTHIPYLENISDAKISLNEKVNYFFQDQVDFNNNYSDNSKYKFFYYQEALRNLYTSIIINSDKNNLKIITVTSSIFGEGKSLLNSLIAKIFSDNDFKVLLIDADLRKPSIHKNFLIPNKLGLSNLLSKEELNIDKYLNKINQNLSIITSGNVVNSDPVGLLSSKKMNEFINKLKKSDQFDLVIFDSPPSLGLSDYKLITRNTDGLIFLVSIGYCKKTFSEKIHNEIRDLNANIIGIVSNTINKTNSIIGYDPIYKYYNYGYGKVDEKKELGMESNKVIKFSDLKEKTKSFIKWIDKNKISNFSDFKEKIRSFIKWIDK